MMRVGMGIVEGQEWGMEDEVWRGRGREASKGRNGEMKFFYPVRVDLLSLLSLYSGTEWEMEDEEWRERGRKASKGRKGRIKLFHPMRVDL